MRRNHIARSSITIEAPCAKVWRALVTPEAMKQSMFGATAVSNWREGDSITWKGVWEGKAYEDKGQITHMIPERTLQYTHFSPLWGLPDKPENYHTVTFELTGINGECQVALTQDNNATEAAQRDSERNWERMLGGLKDYVER